ncbi:ATP synthase subunit g, mitochondrial-like [Battus philenor]|uniref:ATP synthase subunit g, mitochondrial-like n=1 Tax=Battus philenor TaxID=42288 RepID=UPI0035CEDFB7
MNIAKLTNSYLRIRVIPTVTDIYGHAFNRNKEKLSKLLAEKSRKVMQSDLAEKMRVAKHYYKVEMKSPSSSEIQALREDITLVQEFIKNGCYNFLTVRQAWLLFLVSVEVGLWFFMGETIAKMRIVGYKV